MTARSLIRGLLAKPALPDEEQNRRAGLVHTILLPFGVLSLLVLVTYVLMGGSAREISAVAVFLGASVLVLHLAHAGRVDVASWLLVSVLFAGAIGPEVFQPEHDPLPVSMFVVVLAGLLLGGVGAFLFCELSCAAVIIMAYWHAPAFFGATDEQIFTSVIFAAALLHAMALVVHLIHGNLHRALVRARDHARALETRTEQLERTQRDLVSARDQALEATREKTRFLANMSHEIRTPLNAVVGMSQLLLRTSLDSEQREFIDTIGHSSDILLGLVTDILDFSKVESGQVELENAPVDLRAYVQVVARLVERDSKAKGLTLQVRVTDDVPAHILGDSNRIGQVLLNLLNNAIKFTGEGRVELTVTTREPADQRGPELEFAVTDTGIGVAEERIEHLFDAFTQADVSTTRRYGGTGLGLAICRQLVEVMDGRIWVETALGEGSTFRFTIPCRVVDPTEHPAAKDREAVETGPNSLPTASRSQERTQGARQPLSILVTEDNVLNQRVIIKLLERLGYEADVANDGLEAIEALDERVYDIILMDLQMPRMDGLSATRHIRASPGSGPYIVAVTADVTAEIRRRCAQVGMDGFVGKPIRVDDLTSHLSAAFERTRCERGQSSGASSTR